MPPKDSTQVCSKTIKVKIIDDEEYEKNKTFYIEIGEPRLVESNDTKGREG
ncbi:sodium/calcium exchanger 1-like isoform X1, partial [Lates japonicus]